MNKDYLLREAAGEYLLIPLIDGQSQFNSIIKMNETGAFIWKGLEKGHTAEKIAADMAQEYNVEPKQAECDVREYIDYLREKKIL